MKCIAMVICLVTLAGCAQGRWVKPYTTGSERAQDKADCQYDVDKYGYMQMTGHGSASAIEIAMRENDLFKSCMKHKGYRMVYD